MRWVANGTEQQKIASLVKTTQLLYTTRTHGHQRAHQCIHWRFLSKCAAIEHIPKGHTLRRAANDKERRGFYGIAKFRVISMRTQKKTRTIKSTVKSSIFHSEIYRSEKLPFEPSNLLDAFLMLPDWPTIQALRNYYKNAISTQPTPWAKTKHRLTSAKLFCSEARRSSTLFGTINCTLFKILRDFHQSCFM